MNTQLRKLRTLLQTAIDIEAKSTRGPWVYDPENKVGGSCKYSNAPQMVWGPEGPGYGTVANTCSDGLMPYPGGQQARDALFITNAKRLDAKMAKGLLEALNYAEKELELATINHVPGPIARAESTIQSLLALFAKELE